MRSLQPTVGIYGREFKKHLRQSTWHSENPLLEEKSTTKKVVLTILQTKNFKQKS